MMLFLWDLSYEKRHGESADQAASVSRASTQIAAVNHVTVYCVNETWNMSPGPPKPLMHLQRTMSAGGRTW